MLRFLNDFQESNRGELDSSMYIFLWISLNPRSYFLENFAKALPVTYLCILIYLSLRGQSHIDFRAYFVLMTQTRYPFTPCHLLHFPNFDKINSLLKLVLNIFILDNLKVGWVDGVLKEGAGILYQIYRFKGVLIVGGVVFIKVNVGIIYDLLKLLRWNILRKLLLAISC